jgi:hypothetical protein
MEEGPDISNDQTITMHESFVDTHSSRTDIRDAMCANLRMIDIRYWVLCNIN